jgi:choline dehydrogenase-like flavoprotein
VQRAFHALRLSGLHENSDDSPLNQSARSKIMSKLLAENAVVIGGSMAGLMTARVLADHFEQVVVLERDHIAEEPAIHKSIPQGNHLHALLLSGQQVLSRLYPGFTERLQNLGAVRLRIGKDNAILLPEPQGLLTRRGRQGAARLRHRSVLPKPRFT